MRVLLVNTPLDCVECNGGVLRRHDDCFDMPTMCSGLLPCRGGCV